MANSEIHGNVDMPNTWTVRNHKRHVALSRDMEKINSRLTSIEESLTTISSIMATFRNVQGSSDKYETDVNIKDLSHRLERMEILLLRTSVADFSILDSEIRHLLPKTMAADKHSDSEPEIEQSPLKPPGLDIVDYRDINSRPNSKDITGFTPKCLSFDISVDDDDNEFHVAEVELDRTIDPKCPFYDTCSQADALDIDLRSSGQEEDPEDDGKAQTDDVGPASRASPALQDMIMDRWAMLAQVGQVPNAG